jgi:hypothetical protein
MLKTFREEGVVALRGAFSVADAAELRAMLWRHVESTTPVRQSDPATWSFDGHLGLRALEERGVWHPVHGSSAVVDALDEIVGVGAWKPPSAPHLLLTFPRDEPWVMPHGQWHIDFGFELPTWPTFAVKMFALLDTLEPGGGGTLLLKGSHRLVDKAGTDESHLFDSDPYLRMLQSAGGGRGILGQAADVHGVRLRPVEITGEAGDVFLVHMHVFHSPSPNTASRPRQMIGSTFNATTGVD